MVKWIEEDIVKALDLIKEGKSYKYIGEILNRSEGSVRNKVNEFGESSRKYYDKSITREFIKCLQCEKEFEGLKKDDRIFCSQSCNATYHNLNRGYNSKPKFNNCKNCNNELKRNKNTVLINVKQNMKQHKYSKILKKGV